MSFDVIIYCHGTQKTGLGHFSRCFNLALALQKLSASLAFYGQFDVFARSRLEQSGFACLSQLPLCSHPIIVCDDYHFTHVELKELHDAGAKLVIIDDFDQYNFEFIKRIVNFRYQAASLCQASERHLLDLNYFPFHEDLKAVRAHALKIESAAREISSILLFIGAHDRHKIAARLLCALDNLVNGKQIILVASEQCAFDCKNNRLTQLNFVDDMAGLYGKVDMVISGGGLTKYEAGFCLLPNAAFSQTKEQQLDTEILAEASLCYDLGLATATEQTELENRLSLFLSDEFRHQFEKQKSTFSIDSTRHLAQKILEVSDE